MKKVKVILTKTVVLVKEEILEVPDNISENELFDKASDVIYHNGKEWSQKKVKKIKFNYLTI